jgi:hypothetical protein
MEKELIEERVINSLIFVRSKYLHYRGVKNLPEYWGTPIVGYFGENGFPKTQNTATNFVILIQS